MYEGIAIGEDNRFDSVEVNFKCVLKFLFCEGRSLHNFVCDIHGIVGAELFLAYISFVCLLKKMSEFFFSATIQLFFSENASKNVILK